MKKKSPANVMNLVTICMAILAITIVVMVYLQCTELMLLKLEVSQVSRKYILKMESEGYLTPENQNGLLIELKELGIKNVELTGTTLSPVAYGDTIALRISGNIQANMLKQGAIWNGETDVRLLDLEEKRMSTAKN